MKIMAKRKRIVTVSKIVLPVTHNEWHQCKTVGCYNEIPLEDILCSVCYDEIADQTQYEDHFNAINTAIQDDYASIKKIEKSIGKGRLSLGEIQDAQHQIDYLNYHIETLTK